MSTRSSMTRASVSISSQGTILRLLPFLSDWFIIIFFAPALRPPRLVREKEMDCFNSKFFIPDKKLKAGKTATDRHQKRQELPTNRQDTTPQRTQKVSTFAGKAEKKKQPSGKTYLKKGRQREAEFEPAHVLVDVRGAVRGQGFRSVA